MCPLKIDLTEHGIDEQIAKLDNFDAIAAPHIRRADAEAARLIVAGWKASIHSVSGEYAGSIIGEVKSVVGLKSRVVASTDTLAPDRYPYPFMLEKSTRFPKTLGKAARMLRGLKAGIVSLFGDALDAIVRDLRVGS